MQIDNVISRRRLRTGRGIGLIQGGVERVRDRAVYVARVEQREAGLGLALGERDRHLAAGEGDDLTTRERRPHAGIAAREFENERIARPCGNVERDRQAFTETFGQIG